MRNRAPLLPLALATVALAACSPDPQDPAETGASEATTQAPVETPKPAATDGETSSSTLRLEGLGDLTVGEPIPEGSTWAVRGAQISDSCLTASSPDYPGAYAMIVDNQVRRITVSDDSKVTLIEGVGPGSTEEEVLESFPSFVSSPHKYVEAPGKYLTQPGDDPRLRFEIDTDGKVSLVHVGLMPQLSWIEGCA